MGRIYPSHQALSDRYLYPIKVIIACIQKQQQQQKIKGKYYWKKLSVNTYIDY